MTLRLAIDVDGVLADIASAYREVAVALFSSPTPSRDDPSEPPDRSEPHIAFAAADEGLGASRRALTNEQRDRIWQRIKQTPDFWTTLAPLETGAILRLNRLAIEHKWTVVFVTQRPRTVGDSVQRQTQRWLVEQGFELPSVIAVVGPRGRLAAELRVDVLIDDLIENCEDAVAASHATPLLVCAASNDAASARARELGITVVGSFGESLDLLEQLDAPETRRGLARAPRVDDRRRSWVRRAPMLAPYFVAKVKRRFGFG